jgi:hypothetical protein
MATIGFFEETTEQSIVKRTIVFKYFRAWFNVIKGTVKRAKGNVAYIDLFSGPGRYEDGTKSTPLLILEEAIKDAELRDMLITIFNDKDEHFSQSLEKEIKNLPNINLLKHSPLIYNNEVGDQIVQMFEKMQLIPTLFFVDPWGYKGLSLRLINSVLKDWGCDCIFFFNYNRINMGLNNPFVTDHINSLFGNERAETLRNKIKNFSSQKRELAIVEELVSALKDMGGNFVLPFGFKDEQGKRTTHHLFFVSKHFKGYEIMKEIMAKESSLSEQGVPSFDYNLADVNFPNLFEYSKPLEELKEMLLNKYKGKTMTMKEIYIDHNVGTKYIAKNYKTILLELEKEDKIKTDIPANLRKKLKGKFTFGDNVKVTFK